MSKASDKPVAAAPTPAAGFAAAEDEAGRDGGAGAPMSDKQAAQLRALCQERGEDFDPGLTAAQADERIEAMKAAREG
ncbi:DUF3072 domain-containing protein [Profundibacterium mesophilum]|uniref:DUF3072 domain-containing protein n=1 Tax=Profundibacterium mesophilum KAUST100406-0324 TaxID=1037889 RepID=A0A921NQT8_9RHOB|nr:DUF3072 domain-containing protein [Profundibacterium mesophilum]KAF0677226.1 hypothetical protein PMES_00543 [Profundibacterium mesophilum KAUST100406-0324]